MHSYENIEWKNNSSSGFGRLEFWGFGFFPSNSWEILYSVYITSAKDSLPQCMILPLDMVCSCVVLIVCWCLPTKPWPGDFYQVPASVFPSVNENICTLPTLQSSLNQRRQQEKNLCKGKGQGISSWDRTWRGSEWREGGWAAGGTAWTLRTSFQASLVLWPQAARDCFLTKVGIAVKALREMTAVKEIISQLPTPAAHIPNTHMLWAWSRGQEQECMPPSHSPCLWSVASASKQDLCFSSLMIQL